MICSNCGKGNDNGERFCRTCGIDLQNKPAVPAQSSLEKPANTKLAQTSKDPDELMGNGVGTVIMGDGFMMVGVFLSAFNSPVKSMLWLLLLIPAFIFFGKGFADVLHAKQIRRRLKETKCESLPEMTSRASIAEAFRNQGSGELRAGRSVTERTTRQLK